MRNITIALAAMAGFCHCALGGQSLRTGDLVVLDRPRDIMMRDYLTALVDEQFARRASILAGRKTAEDWDSRARLIREFMSGWTGRFPNRTPLNARVTGRIERDRYTLEKVLFESRPSFYVSANLYLPSERSGPSAAVLNVIGHSPEGKATEKVQRRAIAQAQKGFAALVVDGIGQGERQIKDYARFGKAPGNAHQIIGTQAFLAGTHVFNFMVWDAIRAVDYLLSRPEVDPKRIACTGCSGGGMMTTYILAFEPRIAVAVPVCNPNTWSHRVHANLSTDHEQVFFGAFAAGIDPRGDPLLCHVPKPLLINATTDDALNPPSGVWELSAWLYKAYAAHGVPQHFQTTMVKAPHDYNKEQREVAYAWMLSWLGGDASDFREEDFPIEKEQGTWCTPEGNVYAEPGSRDPQELVLEYLAEHRARPQEVRTKEELALCRNRLRLSVRGATGIPDFAVSPQVQVRAARRTADLKLTPLVIENEKGIVLPAVLIESEKRTPPGPVIVYLNDQGKDKLAGEKTILRMLADSGFRVLAVDLRGTGETAPSEQGKFWDFLAGRPIFAQRVRDVRDIIRWLSQRKEGDKRIFVWAKGVSGLYAAFAATLEQGIAGIVLEEPLLSFEDVITTRVPAYKHEVLLPSVKPKFDLPDVYQALCPLRVVLINPLSGDKSLVAKDKADRTYRWAADTYAALGKPDNWSVHAGLDAGARADLLLSAFLNMTGNEDD